MLFRATRCACRLIGAVRDSIQTGANILRHCAPLMLLIPALVLACCQALIFPGGFVPIFHLHHFAGAVCYMQPRGNIVVRWAPAVPLVDPASGASTSKVVFVIFYTGERAGQKIVKVGAVAKAICNAVARMEAL